MQFDVVFSSGGQVADCFSILPSNFKSNIIRFAHLVFGYRKTAHSGVPYVHSARSLGQSARVKDCSLGSGYLSAYLLSNLV